MSDNASTPPVPFEITHKILKLATMDLVEEERRDSALVGHTNAFLVSASLVSRTWRNIAQPLLIKHGLVDPIKIPKFLRELKRTGVQDSLDAVRIGVTDASRRWIRSGRALFDKSESVATLDEINTLLKRVKSLRRVEFVGANLGVAPGQLLPHNIQSFASSGRMLKNSGLAAFRGCESLERIEIFEEYPLHIYHGYYQQEPIMATTSQEVLKELMSKVKHLKLSFERWDSLVDVLQHTGSTLQTLDVEVDFTWDDSSIASSFWPRTSSLISLTTNLSTARILFRRLISKSDATEPTFTELIIPVDSVNWSSPEETLKYLHRLLPKLPRLQKLYLYDGWRSAELEHECEARGIALTWSGNCHSAMSDNSTTPTLPYEITHKILEHATLDLVEQERQDSKLVGHTNAFLLSASLVSHTWRDIAQPLLLRHGLVDPIRSSDFLLELERKGARASIGALLGDLENLSEVEFIGRTVWNSGTLSPHNHIQSFISTGCPLGRCAWLAFLRPFRQVTLIDQPYSPFTIVHTGLQMEASLWTLFGSAEYLHLRLTRWHTLLSVLRGAKGSTSLRTLHLEYDGPPGEHIERNLASSKWATFKTLSSLTLSLSAALHLFDPPPPSRTADPVYPTFTSLTIVANPVQQPYTPLKTVADLGIDVSEVVTSFIPLIIKDLPRLERLDLFGGWKSDAVEEACDARGIALTWSGKSRA